MFMQNINDLVWKMGELDVVVWKRTLKINVHFNIFLMEILFLNAINKSALIRGQGRGMGEKMKTKLLKDGENELVENKYG